VQIRTILSTIFDIVLRVQRNKSGHVRQQLLFTSDILVF